MFMTKETQDKLIFAKFRSDIIDLCDTLNQVPTYDEETFNSVFMDLVANCYVLGKFLDEWQKM